MNEIFNDDRISHLVVVITYSTVRISNMNTYLVTANFTVNGVNHGAITDGSLQASYDASTWSKNSILQIFKNEQPVVKSAYSEGTKMFGSLHFLGVYSRELNDKEILINFMANLTRSLPSAVFTVVSLS